MICVETSLMLKLTHFIDKNTLPMTRKTSSLVIKGELDDLWQYISDTKIDENTLPMKVNYS